MPKKQQRLPTTKELYVLANSLAFNLAHQLADIEDLVHEGLNCWYRQIKLTPHPDKPFAFARTVIQRAMFTYYSGRWSHSGARYREDLPLEAAPDVKVHQTPGQSWDDAIWMDAYLVALEEDCGREARTVAENLIMPQDLMYCRQLTATATAKTLGKVTPSGQQLRKARGLTVTEWADTLRGIKEFTARWLVRTTGVEMLPSIVHRYL